jgi:hypothetical protein
MSYSDNRVNLKTVGMYMLSSATFTVNQFSITAGQDPQSQNKVGDQHTFLLDNSNNPGSFDFSVGRQSSGQVADFFNSIIASTENTFGHDAGELNFAFCGPLALTVADSSRTPYNLNFATACFAQGHSGLTNNWWFGIVGATVSSSGGTITATDTTLGKSVSFQRGGNNADDEVDITVS